MTDREAVARAMYDVGFRPGDKMAWETTLDGKLTHEYWLLRADAAIACLVPRLRERWTSEASCDRAAMKSILRPSMKDVLLAAMRDEE